MGNLGDIVKRTLLVTAGGMSVITLPGCANPGPVVTATGVYAFIGTGRSELLEKLRTDDGYVEWWLTPEGQRRDGQFNAPAVRNRVIQESVLNTLSGISRLDVLPIVNARQSYVVLELPDLNSRRSRYAAAVFEQLIRPYTGKIGAYWTENTALPLSAINGQRVARLSFYGADKQGDPVRRQEVWGVDAQTLFEAVGVFKGLEPDFKQISDMSKREYHKYEKSMTLFERARDWNVPRHFPR